MSELDDCHQRARQAIDLAGRNRIAAEYSHALASDVLFLLGRISAAEADKKRLAEGFESPADATRVAELERQLAEMTRREEQWRKECLAHGVRQMREVTSSFKEFCVGHKAGMRTMSKAIQGEG